MQQACACSHLPTAVAAATAPSRVGASRRQTIAQPLADPVLPPLPRCAQGGFPFAGFDDKEFLPFLMDDGTGPLHSRLTLAADAPLLPVIPALLRRCVTRSPVGRLTADSAARMSAPGSEWAASPVAEAELGEDKNPEDGYLEIGVEPDDFDGEDGPPQTGPSDPYSVNPLAGSRGAYGRLGGKPPEQGTK